MNYLLLFNLKTSMSVELICVRNNLNQHKFDQIQLQRLVMFTGSLIFSVGRHLSLCFHGVGDNLKQAERHSSTTEFFQNYKIIPLFKFLYSTFQRSITLVY